MRCPDSPCRPVQGRVDLGELVLGAGEADLEALDVAEPAFAFGLGDVVVQVERQDQAVHLGMPAFPDIAGRSVPGPEGQQ